MHQTFFICNRKNIKIKFLSDDFEVKQSKNGHTSN